MEETKSPTPYSCEGSGYGHILDAKGDCVHCGFNPYVDEEEELSGRFGEDEIF